MQTVLDMCLVICSVFTAKEVLPQVENLSITVKCHSFCHLKELYKDREGMRLKWPPVIMKEFVNVLCVESTNEPGRNVTEKLVRGHIEKVKKKTRTLIQLREIDNTGNSCRLKCIVVQGATGAGKTMFSWELCRR